MEYVATVRKEGRATLIDFPDCTGCQTFAEGAKMLWPSHATRSRDGSKHTW